MGYSDWYPGWHVDDQTLTSVSTAYRWVTAVARTKFPGYQEAESYTLLPVEVKPCNVLTYSVHPNGPALSRESQQTIVPGDYGIYARGKFWYHFRLYDHNSVGHVSDPIQYYFFRPVLSFSQMQKTVELNSPALAAKVCRSHLDLTTTTTKKLGRHLCSPLSYNRLLTETSNVKFQGSSQALILIHWWQHGFTPHP
jgi:hypothetical protein